MRRSAVLALVALIGFFTLLADSFRVITLGAPLFVILLGIVAACVVGLIGE